MKQGSLDDMESFYSKKPLILEITKICSAMMGRESGAISPDDKLYAPGLEKESDRGRIRQTEERKSEKT